MQRDDGAMKTDGADEGGTGGWLALRTQTAALATRLRTTHDAYIGLTARGRMGLAGLEMRMTDCASGDRARFRA